MLASATPVHKPGLPETSSALALLAEEHEDPNSIAKHLDIPDPPFLHPNRQPLSRRASVRPSLSLPNTALEQSSEYAGDYTTQQPPRGRSKLASPIYTSLREKDDPYFLALPDSSRSKILSNSAPELNTLPYPPPRVHRRPTTSNRESSNPSGSGSGRLLEQLHSSRRHSTLGISSQQQSQDQFSRPVSRRSSIKPPFRLQRRMTASSESSSPNSDSESEIWEDDNHSGVGSNVSTRPSSFSSTASYSEQFMLKRSASANNLQNGSALGNGLGTANANGSAKSIWKRSNLMGSSPDLSKKQQELNERDAIEMEECKILESEYQRFASLHPSQQATALRRNLLPIFSRPMLLPSPTFTILSRKCSILLKYQNTLLSGIGLRSPLAHHDRNTFLEAIASICERREWREYVRGMYDETNFMDGGGELGNGSVLGGMVAAMERFREHERMGYNCVNVAMDCLCKKNFSGSAVEYCGRVLAVAFFYSPGVALRLMHALNVATPFTARLLDEVCEERQFRDLSPHAHTLRSLFPKHLHELVYTTPQRYTALLMTRPSPTITVDTNQTLSFTGEWVHRWRAHNSDVFFSFLRHYHIILSEHLQTSPSELTIAAIAGAPGYLVLQGHILRMLDSFIHRQSNELPVHPMPAPHHKNLTQSTLCKRAFERHPNGPLGPPLPLHLQQGNRMQDSIHAMALLMNSGDGRPQGIEKAEKKLAKAISSVLSAVRKTQGTKPAPIRPGLLDVEDPLSRSTGCISEGESSSTPRTVSTSDISSLATSSSDAARISLPSIQFQQPWTSLFSVLFERTLKAAVRRTSVWEGQACFALCDVIERLLPVIDDALLKLQEDGSLVSLDWPFWGEVVKKLVLQSENSVTQVRAFGFLFNVWERYPGGDEWLLDQEVWETFFCHWSTLVRCYFMNLVCWRVCMSRQSGVAVDPSTILLLKSRLETAQQQNITLIHYAQNNGLPIPVLKASNPLPNRRLVVIASSPLTHEYGITFDSIVPATPASPPTVEKELIEIPQPVSRGSVITASTVPSTIASSKEEKKSLRNFFKNILPKTAKSRKLEVSPTMSSPSKPIPITVTNREPVPTTQSVPLHRGQTIRHGSSSRKPDAFQFSMQPVPSRLDSNKGLKERPTPSSKTIEKYLNPSPVALPRYARDLIRSIPLSPEIIVHTSPPQIDGRWRYAGRALAEWDIIVKQCDSYIDNLYDCIPEDCESPLTIMGKVHIPRMTVELPKFYFTGKSLRDA